MNLLEKLLLETKAIPYFLYVLLGGFILAFLYRIDFLNTYVYVLLIAATIPIYFILIHYFNKEDVLTKWLHLPSFVVIIGALLIESPALLVEDRDQIISVYTEPFEIIAGTNIYGVAVKTIPVPDEIAALLNEGDATSAGTVVSIKPYTNLDKLAYRKYWLQNKMQLGQTDLEVSVKNATAVLEEEVEEVQQFADKNLHGNSAGLALTLSGKLQQEELKNETPIVLTGAIQKDGTVTRVGSVPEKLKIAEMAGFKHAVVPEADLEIAEEAKRKYKLQLEIKAVSHYEEALQYVEKLNR